VTGEQKSRQNAKQTQFEESNSFGFIVAVACYTNSTHGCTWRASFPIDLVYMQLGGVFVFLTRDIESCPNNSDAVENFEF